MPCLSLVFRACGFWLRMSLCCLSILIDSRLKDHVSGMRTCFDLADAVQTKGNHSEQREKLGLTSATKQQSNTRKPLHEPTDAYQKVEVSIWLLASCD